MPIRILVIMRHYIYSDNQYFYHSDPKAKYFLLFMIFQVYFFLTHDFIQKEIQGMQHLKNIKYYYGIFKFILIVKKTLFLFVL